MPTPQTRITLDKIVQLDEATTNLTRSVERLTDVVSRNNNEVNDLRDEIKNKAEKTDVASPDEVNRAKRSALARAVASALIASVVAASVTYYAAKAQVEERIKQNYAGCIRGNARSQTSIDVYGSIANLTPPGPIREQLQKAQVDLRKLQVDCAKLNPVGK